jgi:hypothetical protein
MKSRRARALTVERIFDQVTYAGVDWPLKTVRLERDSVEDFNQRIASPRVSLSEMCHENSKLFRGMLEELAATRVNAEEVRREFLRRREASMAGLAKGGGDERLEQLLRAITIACAPELFFAVELRVLDGHRILSHEPLSNRSCVVKDLTPDDGRRLREAVEIPGTGEATPGTGPLVFVVGNLARNDLLYGPRGYRRTLLEAGRIAQVALRAAADASIAARARFEFFDRVIDAVLESDGTEESTLAVIDLEGPHAR